VIELLLQAERALAVGLLDQAERLYGQVVGADPRNAIAVVGLARVAIERGDDRKAHELAHRALAIDPENAAAIRLVARLEEILADREGSVETAGPVGPVGSPSSRTGTRRGLLGRLFRGRVARRGPSP